VSATLFRVMRYREQTAQGCASYADRAWRIAGNRQNNPRQSRQLATREAWRAVAARVSSPVVEIVIVRSDRDEHRRVIETRSSDIAGLTPPTWAQVTTHSYEPWDRPHVVIDTSFKTVDESAQEVLAAIEQASREDGR
jgi:hypothetical protein